MLSNHLPAVHIVPFTEFVRLARKTIAVNTKDLMDSFPSVFIVQLVQVENKLFLKLAYRDMHENQCVYEMLPFTNAYVLIQLPMISPGRRKPISEFILQQDQLKIGKNPLAWNVFHMDANSKACAINLANVYDGRGLLADRVYANYIEPSAKVLSHIKQLIEMHHRSLLSMEQCVRAVLQLFKEKKQQAKQKDFSPQAVINLRKHVTILFKKLEAVYQNTPGMFNHELIAQIIAYLDRRINANHMAGLIDLVAGDQLDKLVAPAMILAAKISSDLAIFNSDWEACAADLNLGGKVYSPKQLCRFEQVALAEMQHQLDLTPVEKNKILSHYFRCYTSLNIQPFTPSTADRNRIFNPGGPPLVPLEFKKRTVTPPPLNLFSHVVFGPAFGQHIATKSIKEKGNQAWSP